MSTMIRLLGGELAWINGGEWKAETPETADELTGLFVGIFGSEGSDPDPDYTIAQKVVNLLGGEIVENYPELEDEDIPEDAIF